METSCRPHCSLATGATFRHQATPARLVLLPPGTLHHSGIDRPARTGRHQASKAAAGAAESGMAPAPPPVAAAAEGQQRQVLQLQAVDITAENFKPFGQLVGSNDDGKEFDEQDAQLDLSQGQPRFYIMRLPKRGRQFDRITFHANVTQCLGALQPASPWFLVVARPTLSVGQYPQQQDLTAFRIPHGVFVKMHKGTWHAGPLFDAGEMDFYNLELADTNVVDHNTHHYGRDQGLAFQVVD